MKLQRVIIGLVIAVLAGVGLLVGMTVIDATAGTQAADVANVTYPAADGTELVGYLAEPPADPAAGSETRFPAVLMVHEWWGLTEEITVMADTLAAEGYIVLAPDTYRGQVASTVPAALTLRLGTPAERADSDMQAAYDYLAALPNVDPARIAVMGFCYGGGVALRHAVANPAIAATINLYGDTIDDPANFGALLTSGQPLLGIFGADDQQIPQSEVQAFAAALAETDIPHEVTVYPGVGHAFVNPETIAEPGAAQDAWTQILAFFETHLKADAATEDAAA